VISSEKTLKSGGGKNSSAWKMYYYIRNRFHIHRVKFDNKAIALLNYFCFLFAFAGIVLFYQKTDKLKKLSFMRWPIADAFTNNFDATPSLILTRLKPRSHTGFGASINGYLKNIRSAISATIAPQRSGRAANA